MSKELGIMRDIKYRLKELGYDESVLAECDLVINALQHSESVDNANPSEALKELQVIENNITYLLSDCGDIDEAHKNFVAVKKRGSCAIIEQALLKQQEPKNYLKWEDLEFKKEEQTIPVLLNGERYLVKYANEWFCGWWDRVQITNGVYILCTLGTGMKQFFNDLHLEKET